MAYPDSLLADDERVVKHLHPHWITLVRPVLLLIVIVAIGSFLAAIFPGGSLQTPGRVAIGVIGVIALVLVTVRARTWLAAGTRAHHAPTDDGSASSPLAATTR